MSNEKIDKDFKKFCKLITKCGAIQFIGIAKMLNVDVFKEKDASAALNTDKPTDSVFEKEQKHLEKQELRDFNELINDLISHFTNLSARGRKNLLKLMTEATKNQRGKKKYGNNYTEYNQQETNAN